jgi:hypothetical protein
LLFQSAAIVISLLDTMNPDGVTEILFIPTPTKKLSKKIREVTWTLTTNNTDYTSFLLAV